MLILFVAKVGLEPTSSYEHQLLRLTCIPIPPLSQKQDDIFEALNPLVLCLKQNFIR